MTMLDKREIKDCGMETNQNNNDSKESPIASAKKLPKKRKFVPSEEESTGAEKGGTESSYKSVVMPPQVTAVDYSKSERQSTSREEERMEVVIEEPEERRGGGIRGEGEVDLREWVDNHVLAKKDQFYLPGVIRQAGPNGEVWVEFDSFEGKLIIFTDVLSSGKFDVISDASPSVGQVSVGSRVCVRAHHDQHNSHRIFLEGIVYKILLAPVR
jgi:hypothetical protein